MHENLRQAIIAYNKTLVIATEDLTQRLKDLHWLTERDYVDTCNDCTEGLKTFYATLKMILTEYEFAKFISACESRFIIYDKLTKGENIFKK